MHKTLLVEGPDPDVKLISTADANTHLRFSGQDTYVDGLVKAATSSLERYLKRVFITQEWEVYYDCWEREMKIPFPKTQTVDSVTYIDLSGVEQTLVEETDYWVVLTTDPSYIKLAYDFTPPELQYGRPDAIKITFTAGYGDEATDVPPDLIHALKLMIANYFENRGDIVVGPAGVSRIPDFVKDLVHSYKIYNF